MRPRQYVKNLFVFLPLFFGQKFLDFELMLRSIWAFICFSMIASAVYIFNDYQDITVDRQHPVKRYRPMASGVINIKIAFAIMLILLSLGLGISYRVHPYLFIILISYFMMNIFYSLTLKHIAILDIFIIAIGFLLRVYAGGVSISENLKMWIVLMTFLIALFLGLAKRREEILLGIKGTQVRKSVDGYNLEFINAAICLMASVIVVSYISYTVSPEVMERFHSKYLYMTTIFVILGILRYLQIIFVENNSGNPTELLLTDHFLQMTILAWVFSLFVLIY